MVEKAKIVIFTENLDRTTTQIMLWIQSFNREVIRIDDTDENFKILSISEGCVQVLTAFGQYEFSKKDFYWFRRVRTTSTVGINENKNIEEANKRLFLYQEANEAKLSMYWWVIDNCSYYCNPFHLNINKFHVLQMAKNYGFNTPMTIYTTLKKDLVFFPKKSECFAIKPFEGLFYTTENETHKTLTNCINVDNVSKIPTCFQGAIIQEYIDKKYELRCFLFDKRIYTMVIFSQNDESTRVDFRNYNCKHPNHTASFKLAYNYEKKILKLAKALHLDSGSFDILVDKYDNYFFLEVNPIGQFGMVSYPCNYYIERTIALFLIQKLENIDYE